VQRAEPGASALHFKLSDTGCGIPPEFMPQLFAPFKQANSSSTRGHEGLGMGLATAKKLADHLHAELSLASPPGEGVTVSLRLPVSPQH
jgi:signal transduction histidine kinase